MTTSFNADAFMATEIEGELDTEFTPIPEAEYQALIKEVKPGTTTKGSTYMEVIWIIDNPEVRELLGMDEPTAKQTVWLDFNDAGALEFGKNKNVGLGRLRDALAQNTGSPWKPTDLLGQVATVDIKHRLGDKGGVFAEVRSVRA